MKRISICLLLIILILFVTNPGLGEFGMWLDKELDESADNVFQKAVYNLGVKQIVESRFERKNCYLFSLYIHNKQDSDNRTVILGMLNSFFELKGSI